MLPRVLIIDDSDADLLYTRIVLERSGVAQEVVTLESAREALALLAAGGPPLALVLLDINMPGMSGFDFLQALQASPALQAQAPVVVMLTSSPDPGDRDQAMAHACVKGYVVKPLDRESAQSLLALAVR
jgi:CheY-like chemotaxis protein